MAWRNLFWSGIGVCSLIQSSFSAAGSGRGNLEVIQRSPVGLSHWFRPDVGLTGTPADWSGGGQIPVGTGLSYIDVSFIQSRFGNQRRNFEVVASLTTGGLVHFWRDNDSTSFTWHGPNSITMNTDVFTDVSLIQSSLSSAGNGPGNLEVIARRQSDNQIFHFFRPDTPAANWQGPGYVPGT